MATTDQASLDRLAEGITLDGIHYAGIEAKLDRMQGANCWLTMGLREGKNREIKRVLEHLGLSVNRLIRLSFGPFQLGELAEGKLARSAHARVARSAWRDFVAGIGSRFGGADRCAAAPGSKAGARARFHADHTPAAATCLARRRAEKAEGTAAARAPQTCLGAAGQVRQAQG